MAAVCAYEDAVRRTEAKGAAVTSAKLEAAEAAEAANFAADRIRAGAGACTDAADLRKLKRLVL